MSNFEKTNEDLVKELESLQNEYNSLKYDYLNEINQFKQAQISLLDNEQKFRSYIDFAPHGVFVADKNGYYIEVNSAACKITGFSYTELLSMNLIELVPLQSKLDGEIHFNKLLNEGFSSGETQFKRKNGTIGYWTIDAVKISEDRFLGFVVDITERKQSEAKIREKDLEFRKLSLHVPDLIFQFTKRVDGSYFVPIASEGIINIFGCLPEDVVDSFDAIAKVIHPDDSERVINDIELSASNLTPFTCEFRVILPEKGIQWIYSNSTPEKLQDGSITWYGFNTNITIRKNAEELLILQNIDLERQYEEFVQLNEVLKETNLDLEKAKLKAEESDRLKTAFLQNISHEVRTPLNGIIGFSNLLQLDNLSQIEIKDFTKIIQQSGKRLAETVDNILEMSKLETNQIMPNIKPIKINTFMNKLYDNFIDDAGIKGLIFKLNKDSNDNDFQFSSDETILNIILTNLLKNAIKFTYIGSVIFGYEINNGKIMFFVKDSGIGIPENKKNQIFRKFAQANLSITRGYEGAGLGLPISQGLVELLGGNIDIKSEVDKGSTFSFTLVNLNKL